jgi:hypothetical protein
MLATKIGFKFGHCTPISELHSRNLSGTGRDRRPIDIFFAVPIIGGRSTAPTISTLTYSGGGPQPVLTSLIDTTLTLSGRQNLYTVVGCAQCDNSFNLTNFNMGNTKYGLPQQTSYSACGIPTR